jgi:RNA polymerase sigma factor (sigma-70 family)
MPHEQLMSLLFSDVDRLLGDHSHSWVHLLPQQAKGADVVVEWPDDVDKAADEDTPDVMAADVMAPAGAGYPFRAYLAAVRQRARLDHDAELEQFRQLNDDNPKVRALARSTLIQSHLWLVPVVVRRFYRQGGGFEDLVAEGNLGLYRALERFDPARGLRFSTYAKWWVMHAVTASMAASAYPVKLPKRVALQLSRQGRVGPAEDRAPAAPAAPASPPVPEFVARDDENGLEGGSDESSPSQPEMILALKQGLALMREAIAQLPERQRMVLEARYGLNGQAERTLQDLAAQMGISNEGVRKVQLAAMKALRKHLAAGLA